MRPDVLPPNPNLNRRTFMYSMLQLNSLPAALFRFASRSSLSVLFPLSASSTATLPRRSTAGRMCSRRPWNDRLSSAANAATAHVGSAKETYARPLGVLVRGSRGMWTWWKKKRRGQLSCVRMRRWEKGMGERIR